MPINKTLYKALEKQYGKKAAENVYFGMEEEGKPGFKKGLKTAEKEGHTAKSYKELKHGKK